MSSRRDETVRKFALMKQFYRNNSLTDVEDIITEKFKNNIEYEKLLKEIDEILLRTEKTTTNMLPERFEKYIQIKVSGDLNKLRAFKEELSKWEQEKAWEKFEYYNGGIHNNSKYTEMTMKDIKNLCKANQIKLSRVVNDKQIVYKKKELLTKLKRKKIL